ncbi:cytochrome C biogenesis protein CcmD [Azospirillum sp. TSH100]|uniref:heme exporter protein CcmD n=1 Tax=Azospirillum sp. TSH100 TaxID=652764 RepID=UPI000D621E8B|nr:heme exporter protein CcmD [Azospirillum sp. TSH100]PWC89178.1 cytochrome C biogenesis protein CcmD [Azospirillum sp. TSH100]QCG87024.1 heme exporter protein CcmD [Azospirillum sp. TSH100]
MNEFLHMGGYAAYVWPAYGIATLVLLGLLVATWKGLRDAEATLKALESARPARRRTRNGRNDTGRKAADQTAGTPAEASEG